MLYKLRVSNHAPLGFNPYIPRCAMPYNDCSKWFDTISVGNKVFVDIVPVEK